MNATALSRKHRQKGQSEQKINLKAGREIETRDVLLCSGLSSKKERTRGTHSIIVR